MGRAYRDEEELLRQQAIELECQLGEVEMHREELRAMLEAVRIEQENKRRRLSVLSDITVAKPCREPLSELSADGKSRFCGICGQNVYELSAMTTAEVETLMETHPNPCVRFFRRSDGTVMTADCPDPASQPTVTRPIMALGMGATVLAITAVMAQAQVVYGEAKVNVAKTDTKTLLTVLDGWRITHGGRECPTIEALKADGALEPDQNVADPWGHRYEIRCTPSGDVVTSAGPDGRMHTLDDVRAG